jgi:hypothetical protein
MLDLQFNHVHPLRDSPIKKISNLGEAGEEEFAGIG